MGNMTLETQTISKKLKQHYSSTSYKKSGEIIKSRKNVKSKNIDNNRY